MLNENNLKKYFKPRNFINRDLSWLEFNRRVFEEALNPNLPLLDKIKFISIFSSNLDEFFMTRVSGLKEQIKANVIETSIDGLTPMQGLKRIDEEIRPMLSSIYEFWRHKITPALVSEGISISSIKSLNEDDQKVLKEYFLKEIFPVLTPLAFDPGRPFPYISNLSLSFAVLIQKPNSERHFARVKIPAILPRLLNIDQIKAKMNKTQVVQEKFNFVWLEELIEQNLQLLFPGLQILEAHVFRITRDTDLEIQEDEADDLLQLIQENIRQRKFGSVVRLEVEKEIPAIMIETFLENLEIGMDDIYFIDGPLGMSSVMELMKIPNPKLKEKHFQPPVPAVFEESDSIFNTIAQKDIILHHPYDSFTPIVEFVKQASKDPDVLAIKATLYRVGLNSPIVRALIEAAELKKQVAVLVELKARFDEENNIYWAKELEKAGVHVVYGLIGLKTHSKMILVVRKDPEGVKRFVHLGTGNYNPDTAKIYTDLGFFTTDAEICADVSDIFNYLTGYSEQRIFRKLMVAPINLREGFLRIIEQEIRNVKEGGKGHLIFKANALVDPVLIAALYEASQQGVQIDLIIRGICCLVPQVPKLSENIRVRSIVGRFLEHHRIYYAYNNGQENLYLSSADIMQRNLDRRVETAFPIEDKVLKEEIIENILKPFLEDNIKARLLHPNGKYACKRAEAGARKISVQEQFMENALLKANKITIK